jgi:hypothetical protein
MLHHKASAVGVYGIYSRIVCFEDRQTASVRFLHGQGYAPANTLDHLIECWSHERHYLKIGEWPQTFNGEPDYRVGTPRD